MNLRLLRPKARLPFFISATLLTLCFTAMIGATLAGPQILMLQFLHLPLPLIYGMFVLAAITWTALYAKPMIEVIFPYFATPDPTQQPKNECLKLDQTLNRFGRTWSVLYALANALTTFFGGMALLNLLFGISALPMWAAIIVAVVTSGVGFYAAFALTSPGISKVGKWIVARFSPRYARALESDPKKIQFGELNPMTAFFALNITVCYTCLNFVSASNMLTNLGHLLHLPALLGLPGWLSLVLGASSAGLSFYALSGLFLDMTHPPAAPKAPKDRRANPTYQTIAYWLKVPPSLLVTTSGSLMLFYIMGIEPHSFVRALLGPSTASLVALFFAVCSAVVVFKLAQAAYTNIQNLGEWWVLGDATPYQPMRDRVSNTPAAPDSTPSLTPGQAPGTP